MAVGYGYDLRKRVVDLVDAGEPIVRISKLCQVGRATIYRWLKQRREENSIHPKTGWQKGYGHKITDIMAFKAFVEANPNRTLEEMVEAWGGVKRTTIFRALKKVGFTHKKNQLWVQRT